MGIITISRQIGAGETSVAPAVAQQLGWKHVDDRMLDAEAEAMGVKLPYVTHYDERVPGRIEAWQHPDDAARYFEALRRVMAAYAAKGNAVIVGRGGNFLLRDDDALHIRLIADIPFRIRRVMEVRWISADRARETIARTDHDRAAFHSHYFHADWDDPLNYSMVLNTARLGVESVTNMLVAAAHTRWADLNNQERSRNDGRE